MLSLLLLIIFIIVLFTGIGLYFSPSGRIAKEISWNFLGFDGFIMSALVIIHLLINYKMFLGEVKFLFRR
ncbi:MAG: hypothetical protein B5M48_04515 [Candidatus Omnitrophica bacterium 4484_213]|nr:MAG: hypothetical protein B5M48_04515 [Candidatus Omnitrophica bacterium 4484_213]